MIYVSSADAEGTTKASCTHGGTDRNLRDSLSMQKSEISACATKSPPLVHRDSYMVITRFPRDSFAPNRTSSRSPAATPSLFTRRSDTVVTSKSKTNSDGEKPVALETTEVESSSFSLFYTDLLIPSPGSKETDRERGGRVGAASLLCRPVMDT